MTDCQFLGTLVDEKQKNISKNIVFFFKNAVVLVLIVKFHIVKDSFPPIFFDK